MSYATLSRAFGQLLPTPPADSGQTAPHFARVSELAYQLWRESGFARGTELEFWCDAEQQLSAAEFRTVRRSQVRGRQSA